MKEVTFLSLSPGDAFEYWPNDKPSTVEDGRVSVYVKSDDMDGLFGYALDLLDGQLGLFSPKDPVRPVSINGHPSLSRDDYATRLQKEIAAGEIRSILRNGAEAKDRQEQKDREEVARNKRWLAERKEALRRALGPLVGLRHRDAEGDPGNSYLVPTMAGFELRIPYRKSYGVDQALTYKFHINIVDSPEWASVSVYDKGLTLRTTPDEAVKAAAKHMAPFIKTDSIPQ